MANVLDVAAYILRRQGAMTTWKLQKLVYYTQAWHLVWDDKALFREEIEAWANGPVVRRLYKAHKGKYRIDRILGGKIRNLGESERETIDIVLEHLGDKSSQWLSDLTHLELPWREARQGMRDGERGATIISKEKLAEYYGSL